MATDDHGHHTAGVREIEVETCAIERRRERRPPLGAALELPLHGRDFCRVRRQHFALQSARQRKLPLAGFEVQALDARDILGSQQRGQLPLDFCGLEMLIEGQPDIDGVARERELPGAR